MKFAIDPGGRPVSIKLPPANPSYSPSADLMPSLAASRFAATGKRQECVISFNMEVLPIDQVPVEEMFRREGYSDARTIPNSIYLRAGAGDCRDKPRPVMALRAYTDFRGVPGESGARGWTTLLYDIDPVGQPENVRVVASSGNRKLEQRASEALSQSRYRDGGRTGCFASFGKSADVLEAPVMPDLESFGASPDACDAKDRWAVPPRRDFPRAYGTRKIEGWAIVRFDVAPWGEVGNVEVLEAEPTAEFGSIASAMIRNARYKPIANGASGCIERVTFRIDREQGTKAAQDDPEI